MPNSSAMKVACAIASSFATHLTLPFRIMCSASIPCKVREAVKNEPYPCALAEAAFGPDRVPFGREQIRWFVRPSPLAIQVLVFAFNPYKGLVRYISVSIRAVTFVRWTSDVGG